MQENEHNNAVKQFIGNGVSIEKDLRKYRENYDLATLTYLTHLQDKTPCLKYVFKSGVTEHFIQQLRWLNKLATDFQCPALFISSSPAEVDNPHFICGVLYNNQLLFINPQGEKFNKDLVNVFFRISHSSKDNIIKRLYISSDIIQRDRDGQYSCGPICVELLKQMNRNLVLLMSAFRQWAMIPNEIRKESQGLLYHVVSVRDVCVHDISKKIFPDDVIEGMESIRQVHYHELLSLPVTRMMSDDNRDQPSISELNDYLNDEIINASEQVIVWKLAIDDLRWEALEHEKAYQILQKRFSGKITKREEMPKEISSNSDHVGTDISRPRLEPIAHVYGWEIDVPGDNSCLFWAAVMGYLLPVVNDDRLFEERSLKVFGVEGDTGYIRSLFQAYNPFTHTLLFEDERLKSLVGEKFRSQVISYMANEAHKADFKDYYEGSDSFEDYLSKMQQPTAWGGDLEIRAMSMFLECNISVHSAGVLRCYPDSANDAHITIEITYTNYQGKQSKEAERNHYHFNIGKELGNQYKKFASSSQRVPTLNRSNNHIILSIDGGGIRGIIPLVLLQKIEEQVKDELERQGIDVRDYTILDDLDLLAGTSTGGIIVLGLATGMKLEDIKNMYEDSSISGDLFSQKKYSESTIWRDALISMGILLFTTIVSNTSKISEEGFRVISFESMTTFFKDENVLKIANLAFLYASATSLVDIITYYCRSNNNQMNITELLSKVSRSIFYSVSLACLFQGSGLFTKLNNISWGSRAIMGGLIGTVPSGITGYLKEKGSGRGFGKVASDILMIGSMAAVAAVTLTWDPPWVWVGPLLVGAIHIAFRLGLSEFIHSLFVRPKYHSPSELFKTKFGSEKRLRDLNHEVLITSRNMTKDSIQYFTKHHSPDFHAFKCALATSSAPTFFEPYKIDDDVFVDGGTDGIHNNPSYLAWHCTRVSLNKKKKNVSIISLGTGAQPKDDTIKTELRSWYPISLLGQSFFNKYSGEDSHNLLKEEFGEKQYVRLQLQFQLKKDYQLDDISSVENLKQEAEIFSDSVEGRENIKKAASIILSNKYGINIDNYENEPRTVANMY